MQDNSADFSTLPKNAIAEGMMDLVLPPNEIAEELNKIGKQKELYYASINELDENNISNQDEDLGDILHLLNRSIGVDFVQYKMNTVKRRIIRRMMLYKLDTLQDYLKYIRQHVNEVNLLYQDLLINVTTFFRDPETAGFLKDTLLPKIIRSKLPNDHILVWMPACSTGQEAYSMAMLVVETLGDRSASTPVQIFATDLSEVGTNKARLGLYSKDEVIDVLSARLSRFFNKVEGHYWIVNSMNG